MSIFPQDDKERQKAPVGQFVRDFFPHAIAALARHSWENQQKHTPGSTKLTWAKDKSIGTGDQLMRHFMDGEYVHTAWRALELLERQLTGMPPFGASSSCRHENDAGQLSGNPGQVRGGMGDGDEGLPEYRILEEGDIIERGDEYWSGNDQKWVRVSTTIGEPFRSEHLWSHSWWHNKTRRLIKSQAKPEYRILEVGEILQAGDELSIGNGKWRKTNGAGLPVEECDIGEYRRRIP